MSIRIAGLLFLLTWLFSFNCANRSITKASLEYPFQEKILQYVTGDSIPQNGGYYWPKAGNPDAEDDSTYLGTAKNIDYLGVRLSTARENRSTHCVGVSWQVGMSVLQNWAHSQSADGAIINMSVEDVKKFVDKWFIKLEKGGLSSLTTPGEMGSVYALTSHRLGEKIAFENATAGDFVQFWRKDNSGHSCIFLHWVYDKEGETIGFHYWGSQPQTNGIGTDTEYFHPTVYAIEPNRLIDKERFYVGRLLPKFN